jgi:hypothetical protein
MEFGSTKPYWPQTPFRCGSLAAITEGRFIYDNSFLSDEDGNAILWEDTSEVNTILGSSGDEFETFGSINNVSVSITVVCDC